MNELSSLNFKIFADIDPKFPLEELNAIFQTWIQQKLVPELLIDVADYLHVPRGPGMLLVGLEADYSIDFTDGKPGLRYNRKAPVAGGSAAGLRQAAQAALKAGQILERDERLQGKIRFPLQALQVFVNDRAAVPNTKESYARFEKDFQDFFEGLFAGKDFQLHPERDIRQRFGYQVTCGKQSPSIDQLLERLAS